MKVYETNDIRNVALVGHGHSGKTTLVAGALFASGATSRLTRVDEGNTITDFGRRRNRAQDHHLHRRCGRRVEQEKDQPARHPRLQHVHQRHQGGPGGRRRGAGDRGWRGRRRSADRKSLELQRRVPSSPRDRDQQAGARALQFRADAGKRPGGFRPHRGSDPSAHRRGARIQGRGRSDPHEGLHLHDRRRRQGEGRRDPREPGGGRPEGSRSADRNGGRGERQTTRRVLREGHAAAGGYQRGPSGGGAPDAHLPGAVRLGLAQHRDGSDPEFRPGGFSRARRPRRLEGHARTARKSSER